MSKQSKVYCEFVLGTTTMTLVNLSRESTCDMCIVQGVRSHGRYAKYKQDVELYGRFCSPQLIYPKFIGIFLVFYLYFENNLVWLEFS